MLLDYLGRPLARRKQYGFTVGGVEYVVADPARPLELEPAIAGERIEANENDDSLRAD